MQMQKSKEMTSLMLIPVMKYLRDHEINFYIGQIEFSHETHDVVDAVILEPNDDWNDRCQLQCPQYTLYEICNDVNTWYYTTLSSYDVKKLRLEDTEKIVNSYTVFTGESLYPRSYTVKVRVYL